jgi:hypothetical protein
MARDLALVGGREVKVEPLPLPPDCEPGARALERATGVHVPLEVLTCRLVARTPCLVGVVTKGTLTVRKTVLVSAPPFIPSRQREEPARRSGPVSGKGGVP